MYVDSHCHLNFPELARNLPDILKWMDKDQVSHALVVSVNQSDWPGLMEIVAKHSNLYASVGVHPDCEGIAEPSVDDLARLAQTPKVVAIGETGLDYSRLAEPLEWQRNRFRTHIRASKQSGRPLIIHTRAASADTIRIMQEEGAKECGGVMHCFTESWEIAQAAMDMGFYISLSGIVTFKNAKSVQDVASKVPLERLLIETDSPYLSPAPHRGVLNDPSKVTLVAKKIAELRGIPVAEVAQRSTENFFRLFSKAVA